MRQRCVHPKAPQGRKPPHASHFRSIALRRPGSASDVSNRSNQGVSLVHRSSAYQQIDFETLYRMYWPRIVRFCTTCLAACPDGTAEEVAQDVFLAAHRALVEQRYRGDGSLSTWLFGIARNLCGKVARDRYRQTTPLALRRLERDIAHLEHYAADRLAAQTSLRRERGLHFQEQLTLVRHGLEGARAHLQERVWEASHSDPPEPPETQDLV